jgi:hypothetical protein
MKQNKKYTLEDEKISSLFEKFSYSIVRPCISSSQKEKAIGISKILWLALVTGTDSEQNIYNTLGPVLNHKHDDVVSLGSLYFYKMKKALTKKECLKLKKHYSHKVLTGSLLVEFTPDASRLESVFYISTDNEEVTVGFDRYHSHFKWPAEYSDWRVNPLTFIDALLHDRIVVKVGEKAGKWTGSSVLEADEEPELSGMEKDHVVTLRSWSGRLDRVYTYSSGVG